MKRFQLSLRGTSVSVSKKNLLSFLLIASIVSVSSCKKDIAESPDETAITANSTSDIVTVTNQVTDKTVFPLSSYLYVPGNSPYPLVNQSKLDAIDKSNFKNVLNYGAKGDGRTYDDAAIVKAFNAANQAGTGVIFPSGKTFLVSKLSTIRLSKNVTVYAYGATIKMADNKRYSALQFDYPSNSKAANFIWLGGTFDGNKDHQSWPGSPTGKNSWAESHGRFIGVAWAQFALFKDVNVVNTVVDGIGLERNKIGVISDSKASGGAQIQWSENAEQGTYFKCTREAALAFYVNNVDCEGGSIGVHYSTSNFSTADGSVTTITNSHFKNQSQNPVHFEDCRRIFLSNCTVEKDLSSNYDWDFQISNQTWVASIKNCHFRNIRLNFNEASSLKLAIINGCDFTSEYAQAKGALPQFIEGRPTVVVNSSFAGKAALYQGELMNVRNCSFKDFGSLAISSGYAIDDCSFSNGTTAVSMVNGGFVTGCTFSNVKNSRYGSPKNDDWKRVFSSVINIVSDQNNSLGQITCN
jgi:hypothetical protein